MFLTFADTKFREEGRPPQQGSIVNCASVNSIMAGPATSGYSAAKHAVNGITKAAALEARKHNIRVNSVSPGFLPTKLAESAVNDTAGMLSSKTWYEDERKHFDVYMIHAVS